MFYIRIALTKFRVDVETAKTYCSKTVSEIRIVINVILVIAKINYSYSLTVLITMTEISYFVPLEKIEASVTTLGCLH